MPQTNIENSSRTECNNDECVRVTRNCIDGHCTERRVVIEDGDDIEDTEDVTTSESSSDESSNDGSPENGCRNYADKTFTVLINDIDVTIPSFILSLVVFVMLIFGIMKMKKK